MNKFDKAIEDFEAHCLFIKKQTNIINVETPENKERRIKKLKANYNELFLYYFPHYALDDETQKLIDCAPFHISGAKKLLANKVITLILNWFRGGAKSVHACVGYAIWLWIHGELNFMLLVGENDEKAKILLGDVQAEFESNQRLINDFGNQNKSGIWTDGSFKLKDGTRFHSIGLGMSPRGLRDGKNRPDYIVTEDLDTKKRCKNPTLVLEAINWIIEDLRGCFGRRRRRHVHCNNNIAKVSILTGLVKKLKNSVYSVVTALKKDGTPSWAARDTKEYWAMVRDENTYRSWEREYNNNPIEEGNVFKTDWIKYENRPAYKRFDDIICYIDPSFKSHSKADYKAAKTWGRIGTQLWELKAFVRQCSVSTMVKYCYDLKESFPKDVVLRFEMEANFIQDTLLDEITAEGNERGYQLNIIGDDRKKPDKFQRIESASAYWERGFVSYDQKLENDPDHIAGKDQLLAFEKGTRTNDDSPDADEGAIFKLQDRGREEKGWGNIRIGKRKSKISGY